MSGWLARTGTGLVGAVVEAWAELRIHRTRVLLSLIGVAVAVAAITSVVGLGAVVQQSQTEQMERQSGRPASLSVSMYSETGAGMAFADQRALLAEVADRYGITWSTAIGYTQLPVELPGGTVQVAATVVDPDYGQMRRVDVAEGRWFGDRDVDLLAPTLVVNRAFLASIGSPEVATHPTVVLQGEQGDVTAVIVGAVPDQYAEEGPSMHVLSATAERVLGPEALTAMQPQMELWVPEGESDGLTAAIQSDVAASAPDGVQATVNRNDYGTYDYDPLLSLKILVGGVAGLVLLLGALGLVNISLVTVKQRIREIGVRRSFGASAGRVFFAVMMESIVATVAAGVVGVMAAVAIVKNPWILSFVASGVTEFPPFPLSAALLGLGASLAVGAIAGLLPALVAVRVSVIDAIRY
ncbi:putative ABC transport system permease protein [Clavibacter michiganensis]|uniref:ABC transporter permease n=1 Tax=Clavibacter michiganensis TaxID=28447 RepID=UPI001AE239A0|nr:ABC transporter permease [Clavibacter michiganensis]MBP2458733.1 putative ABC transport system permease protein [Clavibacter michiganensis]MDQ0411305.1 putative ABC transport system permease protein [Clavibacter michiganensis]